MTFTEAAVEVLRLVGKPLHYKRITELAIERNLLSHVGKTPEVTMSSRLATMVKRDRGEAPIVKVKPGVFGLREFDGEHLVEATNESIEATASESVEGAGAANEAGETATEETPTPTPSVAKPPSRPLPGSDVFPEEDDDDEPIFGTPASSGEDGDDEGEGDGDGEGRSKRRRRRRKRGRGDDGEDAAATSARDSNRDRDKDREGGRRRGRDRADRDRGRDEPTGDWNREHSDGDLVGKDLADSVVSVLQTAGRSGMSPLRIAERLVRKGRLAGDPAGLIPTISAAVRADLARSQSEGQRPRFRHEGGSIVLIEALLPQDLVRAEQEVLRAADRQRDRARRAYLRRLGDLPFAGLAELLATWLNAEGVVSLRAVRRPGTSGGELHMAGTYRRGSEETRLAIVFYRDGRDLGRERVIEVRGALHHYGNASAAWVVTMGQVLSGAREEATAPGTPPIAVFDGAALAMAMERVGVGLTRHSALLTGLDFELLDALGGDGGRGRDGGRRRTERQDRPERAERQDRSERSERKGRSERSERSDEREEAERPRRRRDRGRGAERESVDDEETAKDPSGAADASSETPEGAENGDTGEAGEGSRRRRRRRRRGRDREGPTVGTEEDNDGSEDAGSAQKTSDGAEPSDGSDGGAGSVADAGGESGAARDADEDGERPRHGRGAAQDADSDEDDDEERDDRDYDDDDEDYDDGRDSRDYDDDTDDEDDEYDEDDVDEDEPRRTTHWSGADDSDEDDGEGGENRSDHRDDEERS